MADGWIDVPAGAPAQAPAGDGWVNVPRTDAEPRIVPPDTIPEAMERRLIAGNEARKREGGGGQPDHRHNQSIS